MLRDFFTGTLGKLIQILFLILGIMVLIGGIFGGSVLAIIIGIVLLCASFGVRYALGSIFRMR